MLDGFSDNLYVSTRVNYLKWHSHIFSYFKLLCNEKHLFELWKYSEIIFIL